MIETATKVKEHPMLCASSVVRNISSGKQTQDRRPISRLLKFGPITEFGRSDTPGYDWWFRDKRRLWQEFSHNDFMARCCPVKVGDTFWVRETFAAWFSGVHWHQCKEEPSYRSKDRLSNIFYRATHPYPDDDQKWVPAIHMPRWASRITLTVTDVRIERIQDITEADAMAEGIMDGGCINCGKPEPCLCDKPEPDKRDSFAYLWQRLYPGSWERNDWVFAYTFRRIFDAKANSTQAN